VNLFNYRYSAV